MKIIKLLEDYNIDYVTKGKNIGSGWIGLQCPFCNDTSIHLCFNEEKEFFHCWKCGFHKTNETIAKLLNMSKYETRKIIKQYEGKDIKHNTNNLIKIEKKPFKAPSNCKELNNQQRAYLRKRRFDPGKLIQEWGLLGTSPISFLDEKEYKHRIIIPIWWHGKVVSFQGRDTTGKSELRYKACPQDREIIHHQDILYGKQEKWGDIGICVEGVTDVWRFGFSSFATFGISYTREQVRNISKHFKKVVIVFDSGETEQKQADKLMAELQFRGIQTRKEIIKEDPASMKQEEADYFVKQIIK